MPNKYYNDGKGNIRIVSNDKEDLFKSKFPKAREATSKELSDLENRRAGIKPNFEDTGISLKDIDRNLSGLSNIPDYSSNIKNKGISIGNANNDISELGGVNSPFVKPSKNGVIDDNLKKIQSTRRNDSDYIVDSAIREDKSYNDWIKEINNDPNISDNVRRELNDWYNTNFRDTHEPTEGIRIPSLVKDYLDSNKQTVPDKIRIQGSSMFGGDTYIDGTKEVNTPEQLAYIADFLVNSPKGRAIVEDEKRYLNNLDSKIDELSNDIQAYRDKRRELYPENKGLLNYLRKSNSEKEESNKSYDQTMQDLDQQYPYEDIKNTESQLNELKKLRSAYNDRDKGAIKQILNEFGRRLPYDLANAGSLGTIELTDSKSLDNALKDPKNVLTRKGYDLVNEYQQAHQLDRSIAQDIAQGTSKMISLVAQYAASEGIVSAATKLPSLTGVSRGTKALMKASETAQRGLVRTAITPQTLTNAYKANIDNPGSFLDALAQTLPSTYLENFTEDVGRYIPEPKPKNKLIRNMMERTGVQGAIGEMAEEELGMILQPLADGSHDWSDLVNPRNQAVTFGTIAMMQLPYASIAAGGYAAGKVRNIKQKRSIRKGYNSNLTNMNYVFGEESGALIGTINQIIDTNNNDDNSISSALNAIVEDPEATKQEKDAAVKYALSYMAMSSLNKAKHEDISNKLEGIKEEVKANVNPKMDALVSAKLKGVEEPVQIMNGNIVFTDGMLDVDKSDSEIYYIDNNNNRKVAYIKDVEDIVENVSTQDAIALVTEQVATPIIAQQENDEVREYQAGKQVRFSLDGNTSLIGQIEGQEQSTGNYLLSIETPKGIQQMQVEPRQIINEDNLEGVENGSPVIYTNQNGEKVQDVVATTPDLYAQGLIAFENGDVVKIENVIGLAQNSDVVIPISEKKSASYK